MTRPAGDDKKKSKQLDQEVRIRIAARIDEARRRQTFTLKFLEDSAQVPRGTLSRLYAGKLNISISTLVKLAYALDIDVSELLRPGLVTAPKPRAGRPRTKRSV